jgi:hypothetical protein
MKARMLERFDANKNGVLDPEEKEAARQAFRGRRGHRGAGKARLLEQFDANKNGVLDPEANGDGKLDQTEREAARKEFRGRRGEGRPEQN